MLEIKVLQGLNLESKYTTIRIDLDNNNQEEIKNIVEDIKGYHQIFLKEFFFEANTLVIRSKLPFLWKEIGNVFQRISKKDLTVEYGREYIIEKIIKKRIKSMSTIPILHAAHNMNIETTPAYIDDEIVESLNGESVGIFNRYYVLGCGRGSEICGSIASTKDAHFAEKLQKDKWSTNTFIDKLNFPQPKWDILNDIQTIDDVWEQYSKPLVIKPTGLTGGHGVSTGIKTKEDARKAYRVAERSINERPRPIWQQKIMIQEQVPGEDYRLLVIDSKLEIATKRIPAFIIGDGKHTIEEIIEETNKDPRRNVFNPAHILKPIKIDSPLKEYLKEQGLNLKTVLEKDQKIYVRKVASMSQGGITEDVTDSVCSEIKLLVESIATSLHAFTLGVDVICKDISKPLTQENGAILEVNTMPEAYLNMFPVLGKQREYVAETYVKNLLKRNKVKKVVVVGETGTDIPTLLRRRFLISRDDIVGEIHNGRYIINGFEISNTEQPLNKQIDGLKRNSLLDVLVVQYRDWSEVEQYGLGFDEIDILYVSKDQAKDSKNMRTISMYNWIRLIKKVRKI